MNKSGILEDINVILEGNLQRVMGSSDGRMRIPYSDKSVELLYKLSQKILNEERDYFWEIVTKQFNEEILETQFSKKPKEQKTLANINNNFGRVFEFLIKANKMDTVLRFFKKERNIDYKVVAVLYKIRELLNQKYVGFNREILIALEEYVNLLVNQFDEESKYEERLAQYEMSTAEEKRVIAIDGVKLDTPIVPSEPAKPRKNYISAEQQDLHDCAELIKDIYSRIRLSKLEILEVEYEGVNLEVNRDQESLKTTINEFRFDPILNASLDKISQYFYEAKDEFDFKIPIDFIRTFLHKLCISIGCEIEKSTKIQHSEAIEEMGKALAYFGDKRVKFLSEKEFEFLVKFNGFISDTGVHSLKSDKEYARIAKNFAVEIGLFLVERLKKYLDDYKNNQQKLS